MIDKAKWFHLWGYGAGSLEGEAAWAEKSRPPRRTAAIMSDAIEPCRGMDGRTHDSLSSYRRTLKADGNPQGESYTELGNESLAPVTYDFDSAQRRDDIRAALQDVKNSRVPPLTVLEDFHV